VKRRKFQFANCQISTPAPVVDLMVNKLFLRRRPTASDILVDPGSGRGAFIQGVVRYCRRNSLRPPHIVGVELDFESYKSARRRFAHLPFVELMNEDYLDCRIPANFIIGNPPYVPITQLNRSYKAHKRDSYETAVSRFDLYLLFFERSLDNLKVNGRLCLITPEKFEYIRTAAPLRRMLARYSVEEIHHVDEDTFSGFVTYPVITTLEYRMHTTDQLTVVRFRDGHEGKVRLPSDGTAWNCAMYPVPPIDNAGVILADVCKRISAGVATGADDVFVLPRSQLPSNLRKFSFPTLSGRQLALGMAVDANRTDDVILIPYDSEGQLLPEKELGELQKYLRRHKKRLEQRSCLDRRKRRGIRNWYRFHESIPLRDITQPKILCKDIAAEPTFVADVSGKIVPRHSLYYLLPSENVDLAELLAFLRSRLAREWLKANCQRAANSFCRFQSQTMRLLPVPATLHSKIAPRLALADN
jgi:adenine-specific DNA-methyltransferase